MFSGLDRKQKEAVGLLSIGTFLEYFDLMLYVHMAVLLNELFFPKTDPFTASLLAAFAFSSTYVLRPFGALLFGYIGDNIGRKHTVVITTFLMSLSCIIMATLPTYAEIGITAAWLVTICRMLQGLSSMGEAVGAELYLTEITKPPIQYPVVSAVTIATTFGTMTALGIASLTTAIGFNWRYAFIFGAGVALIGSIARTALRETPDFADAKKRIQNLLISTKQSVKNLEKNPIWLEKVNKKTAVSLFLIQCLWPVTMYFSYIHCGNIAKETFGLSPEQVITQNFIVSLVQLASHIIIAFLSYKINPISIVKIKLGIFSFLFIFSPFFIDNILNSFQLMLLQMLLLVFGPTNLPITPILFRHFPVLKRFTSGCLIYALSRAMIHVVTAFGVVYLVSYFGSWGVLFIIVPVVIGYKVGLSHFENLEREAGNYPSSRKWFSVVYNQPPIQTMKGTS